MTFDEFKATGRDVDNLETMFADCEDMGDEQPGRSYMNDTLWIADTTRWRSSGPDPFDVRGKGRWYTIIERSEYRSNDLESIEKLLYDFSASEQSD